MDCDAKRATALPDGVNRKHALSHPLVHILDSEPTPKALATEIRLTELEANLAALGKKMENRFDSVKAILKRIAEESSAKS